MRFGAVLPVRLDTQVEKRLEVLAAQSGTTKSALIRLLAKTFVTRFVDEDGSVRLPPNWMELLAVARGDAAVSASGAMVLSDPAAPYAAAGAAGEAGEQSPKSQQPARPTRRAAVKSNSKAK